MIKISSKTDLRAYFTGRATGSDGPAAKKKNPNPEIIAYATDHVNRAEIEMVMDEAEKSAARQSYNNTPRHIHMEVGKYALAHSTKDALAKFSKQYPKYTFKHTSISSWKASFKNNGNSQNLKKIGRPNLLSEELLKRTKDVTIGSRLENTVISRRMVITNGAAYNPGTRYTSQTPPSVFKYLYVVNNYTDYRNFSIIFGATKIFADL